MLKVLKKVFDFIFYMIVILIFIILLIVLGYFLYFQSSMTKVISGYSGMGDVRIEFDQVDTDIIANYPYGNLSLANFRIIDASDPEDEKFIVDINELSLNFKNSAWQDKRLLISDIKLDSGQIHVHRDSLGHFNINEIFKSAESNSKSTNARKWSLDTDSFKVDLKDMLLTYITDDKYKSIVTSVKSGTANVLQNADGSRQINSFLDLDVIDFTLNQENGSFLRNANVTGPIDLRIDQEGLHIDQSTLTINNQELMVSAEFYKNQKKYSYLRFINNKTDFENTKLLLSPKLQTTLQPYKADGLFKADARLTIMPSHPLRVDIDFVFPGNNIRLPKQVFYNTKMSGHFVNDNIYDKTLNKVITEKNHIRFDITTAETIANGAAIQLNKAVLLAGKNRPARITSNALISGPTALISSQLKNDKFIFEGGSFDIVAKLKGPLNSVQNMIEESDLNLEINNCNVKYLPSEVILPLQNFHLTKESGDGDFNIIGLTDDQEYSLTLIGAITNVMEVINGNENIQSLTHVNLTAKRLSWEDFINILGKGFLGRVDKTPFEKRRDMKKTLKGFQDHFQPNIYFEIDSSGYYDFVSMKNIVAHMHFPEHNLLAIDSVAFNLDQGHFDLSCNYDISSELTTPFEIKCNAFDINLSKLLPSFDFFGVDALRDLEFLPKDFDIKIRLSGVINDSTGIVKKSLKGDLIFNSTKRRVDFAHINFNHVERFDSLENNIITDLVTTIEIKGNPLVFNNYLKNDQFFFNEGNFELNVNYTGETFTLDNIISDGELTLRIDSSFVFYEPLSVTFPLTQIGLSVKKDDAKYSILMQSDSLNQEIKFDGYIQNVSEIIVEDTGQPVRTTSNIYSPRVTWKNFIDIFDIGPNEMVVHKDTFDASQKSSTSKFCELLYRFSPEIVMRFDTLEYSDNLGVHDFSTELSLLDSVFYISDAQFNYRDSDILLNSVMYISDDIDSIDVKLNAKNIDIKNFVNDVEELTKKDLASIDNMSGTIDFDVDVSQNYKESGQVSDTIITGSVNFTINNLMINEAPWLEKIGRKLRYPSRFKNVKFAPISNHLTFVNDSLYVPLMEVQSNAFDVFVEGHYHKEYPNIWLSIPLFNLKERDLSVLPDKEGYARRRTKFHLEYARHKKQEPSFKLRLRKRKFYKDRGMLAVWKKLKKGRR